MPRTTYKRKTIHGNTYYFKRLYHPKTARPRDIYGKTIAELEEKIEKTKKDLNQGIIRDNVLFINYLETYLKDVHYIKKRKATINRYESVMKNYIRPSSLSRIRLRDLTVFDMQNFYKEVIKKGAGESNVITIKKIIHPCIRYAFSQGKIPVDFSRSIIIPEVPIENKSSSKRAARALSIDEEQKLRKIIKGHKWEPFIITALGSGLRHGELLALTWDDIDFEKQIINVNKSYNKTNGLGSTKTKSSIRQVPVKKEVIEILKIHRARQIEHRLKIANKYEDNNLVFSNPKGNYLANNAILSSLKKITEENNMEKINVHDFRDTYATRLYEQTGDLKMIQQLLGHSDITTTANDYTSVSIDKKTKFISDLENA